MTGGRGRAAGLPAVVAALAAAGATGCAAAGTDRAEAGSAPVQAVVLTSSAVPLGVPQQLSDPLAPGTVVQRPGADDATVLTGARLRDGVVTARLPAGPGGAPLRVVADFYDPAGVRVDSAVVTLHAQAGQAVPVRIAAAPALRTRVASAFLSVTAPVGPTGARATAH